MSESLLTMEKLFLTKTLFFSITGFVYTKLNKHIHLFILKGDVFVKKHFSLLVVCAISFLMGCSNSAPISPSPITPLATNSPEQESVLPSQLPEVQPKKLPDIQNAIEHELIYQDELKSTPDMVRRVTLPEETLLECSYDKEANISHLYVSGIEVLSYPWEWDIHAGEYDLTGDGENELILFIRPTMANSGNGNLHVYDPGSEMGGIKEILTFRGERYWDGALNLPVADGNTYLELPNEFFNAKNPNFLDYSKQLITANIMEDDGVFFLQLVHDMNESENAYSYLMWDNGWQVIKQEIEPR